MRKSNLTAKITKDTKVGIINISNFVLFLSFVVKNAFPLGCGSAALG